MVLHCRNRGKDLGFKAILADESFDFSGDDLGRSINGGNLGPSSQHLDASGDDLGRSINGGNLGPSSQHLDASGDDLGRSINGGNLGPSSQHLDASGDDLGRSINGGNLGPSSQRLDPDINGDNLGPSSQQHSVYGGDLGPTRSSYDLASSSRHHTSEHDLNPFFKRSQPLFPTPQTTTKQPFKKKKRAQPLHFLMVKKKKPEVMSDDFAKQQLMISLEDKTSDDEYDEYGVYQTDIDTSCSPQAPCRLDRDAGIPYCFDWNS
uniref:Uncharacterized protein n=1 Tax=Brassica oleracea var. oleracea TaxID=109376 RepID=A0A0D3DR89_BRAOL